MGGGEDDGEMTLVWRFKPLGEVGVVVVAVAAGGVVVAATAAANWLTELLRSFLSFQWSASGR